MARIAGSLPRIPAEQGNLPHSRASRLDCDAMGRGRRRSARLAIPGALVVGLGLLGAGCGSESHPNVPRPPVAAEVTVAITDDRLSVSPDRIAFEGEGTTDISQNEQVVEPDADPDQPLLVNFTIANTTRRPTKLVLTGPEEAESNEITANGTTQLRTVLQTGSYRVRAPGVPRALPVAFAVGPERKSAQSDLLLP